MIKRTLFLLLISCQSIADPITHQGTSYPQGNKSFADKVTYLYTGDPAADKKYQKKRSVLGKPDYNSRNKKGMLSLGCNGSVTVEFKNNVLADDDGDDLYIVEVGTAFEDAKVEVSKQGTEWITVGTLKASGKKIDIQGKVSRGVAYHFVKITDLASDCSTETRGADIDAVATLNRPISEIPLQASAHIKGQSPGIINPSQCPAPDVDGDGVYSIACGGSDCDDNDPNRFPGNLEVADAAGHDEDCDPTTHGGRDSDGDGFADTAGFNIDVDGTTQNRGKDCDDSRTDISPMASEVCDGVDNNCDGQIDEGVKVEFFQDADGDLFGNSKIRREACATTEYFEGKHWVRNKEDCDDNNARKNPILGCQ